MKAILALLFLAAFALIGCSMLVLPTGEKGPYCDKNLSCLSGHAVSQCSPASATYDRHGVTADLQVSQKDGKCNLHVQLVRITPSDNADPELNQVIDQFTPIIPILNMDCKINYGRAISLGDPRFLQNSAFLETCSGRLKDEVLARIGPIGNFAMEPLPGEFDERDVDDPKYWPTPYPSEYFYTPTPEPTPTPTPRPTYTPKVYGNFAWEGDIDYPLVTPTLQPTPRPTPRPTATPWVKPTPQN